MHLAHAFKVIIRQAIFYIVTRHKFLSMIQLGKFGTGETYKECHVDGYLDTFPW